MISACAPKVKYTKAELEDPALMLEKGREYYLQGWEDNAIKVYNNIIESKFPKAKNKETEKAKAWAEYEIGFTHYMQKEYDKALKELKAVIKNSPLRAARRLAMKVVAKIEKDEPYKRSTYVD